MHWPFNLISTYRVIRRVYYSLLFCVLYSTATFLRTRTYLLRKTSIGLLSLEHVPYVRILP